MSTTNGIDIQKGPEGKSRATQPMLLVWSGAVDISMQARPWHLLDGSKGTASNIMVASVRMDERFKDSPEMAYKTLRGAVKFTLVEQLATPQPIHVIGGSDLRKAMADLQSGGVVGKRVIQLDPEHVFMVSSRLAIFLVYFFINYLKERFAGSNTNLGTGEYDHQTEASLRRERNLCHSRGVRLTRPRNCSLDGQSRGAQPDDSVSFRGQERTCSDSAG